MKSAVCENIRVQVKASQIIRDENMMRSDNRKSPQNTGFYGYKEMNVNISKLLIREKVRSRVDGCRQSSISSCFLIWMSITESTLWQRASCLAKATGAESWFVMAFVLVFGSIIFSLKVKELESLPLDLNQTVCVRETERDRDIQTTWAKLLPCPTAAVPDQCHWFYSTQTRDFISPCLPLSFIPSPLTRQIEVSGWIEVKGHFISSLASK